MERGLATRLYTSLGLAMLHMQGAPAAYRTSAACCTGIVDIPTGNSYFGNLDEI